MMMTILKNPKRITRNQLYFTNLEPQQMKNLIKTTIFFVTVFISFSTTAIFAQQAPVPKVVVNRLTDQVLTDSGMVNKKIRISESTYPPGFADTVSHRHAAEIFIYIIEGTLEHRMRNDTAVLYKKGQLVHEPPYSLHTLTRNPSATEPVKLLFTFIYTDGPGTPKTIREYPVKKQ
jgi:quercetin dioxygenase-like cupin family protein